MKVRIAYGNRVKSAQRVKRQWHRILNEGKRNIGIPAIRRIKV